jgi:hypothetical protein
MEAFIKDLAAAYSTARNIRVVWIIGLECNRNMSVQQVCQVANWVRQYAGPSAQIVCGSASQDFLKGVHAADSKIGLWKEQDGHPINAALTQATYPAYLSELDELSRLVGAKNVFAGEWYCMDENLRKSITSKILEKGMNCGCGQFK